MSEFVAPAATPARKVIPVSAWVYAAAAVVGAWPVADSFSKAVQFVADGGLRSLPFDYEFLAGLNQLDWVLQSILEPIVLIAGVALAFTKLPKLIRALPGFVFVAGFLLGLAIVFAYGSTLGLGAALVPAAWGFLVGDVPHAVTYVGAMLLAGTASFLAFTEKPGAPVASPLGAPAPAQPASRTPVAFDTQTGQPIYGYDTQTGQPIY